MAICRYCGVEMTSHQGCTPEPIVIEGAPYEPVRFGTEPYWKSAKSPCRDCGTPPGAVHHHGCDVERCPKCRQQSITCGCLWAGEEHLAEDWVEDMEDRLRI